MHSLQFWVQVATLLADVAIVGTFFVYRAQMKTMQGQLLIFQRGTEEQIQAAQKQLVIAANTYRAQNLIALNQVVTDSEFRATRKTLINLRGRPLSSWSADERHAAERACGLWNFVAQLVLECEIPDGVVQSMDYTVVSCHDAASDLLRELRASRSRNHWTHFSQLADRLRKSEGLITASAAS